ncbi:MAG: ABC transporter ATP-binding protein [Bacteroidetes bacterium]|nr:MAG: ABC transporter ATP-binding protein [Bacteroidota bacterium]
MSDNNPPKKQKSGMFDWPLIRRIFGLAAPYKKQVYLAIFVTLISAWLGPYRTKLIKDVLDNDVAKGDYEGLINMTLFMIALLIINTAINFWQSYVTAWLGQAVIKDLRLKVYAFVTRLKLKFFDRTPVGTMVTRTVSDIESLSNVFSEGLIVIAGDILQIGVILYFMFSLNWQLTLVCLSVLPLLLIAAYIFKEKVKSSFTEVRNAVANLNAFVQEHITGMQIVQIFNREREEYKRFKSINSMHRDANIRSVMYYSVFFPVVEIITALATGLVVWYGVKGVIGGDITYGIIVSFIVFINQFFRPIRQLADRINTLQMGMVAAERVFKLIDDKAQLEPEGTYKPDTLKGEVEFKNVWFAYNEEDWVLRDVSFKVKEGKTLALVGATGAGKSSIVNLINKFYTVNQGEILVDHRNVNDYQLASLRSNVAVVLQDVFLFSGSISDNVRLYDDYISKEKIIEAAKLIGAEEFIQRLPGGYDFNVMERGSSLSVGQRQMISFIRALAADPKILILDEATSSVDSETEELIQHAIEVLMKGRTSIAIAHRLSTIQNADEILVLEKGQIVESGTHEELLNGKGYYEKLYNFQFAGV